MKIKLCSVMVDDQEKALAFYTEVLGFRPKEDVPMGEARWITVVPAEGPDDVELALEPMGFEPARTFQRELFEAGVPLTAFAVDDVRSEHERLLERGVVFRAGPTESGPWTYAVFEDTCGNLIQIYQD